MSGLAVDIPKIFLLVIHEDALRVCLAVENRLVNVRW